MLQTLVDRCLELRWQREENRRHVQRLEQELAAARAFQQGLLPSPEALVTGLAIDCRYTPAPSSVATCTTMLRPRSDERRCSSPTSPVTARRRRC